MTKNELKIFIRTLPDDIQYCNFRTEVAKKLTPVVRPKEFYYQWYGILKDMKRGKV